MKILNRALIEEKELISPTELNALDKMPEKILQFGEGKFLRGFLDWMVNLANGKGVFQGRAVIAPPLDDSLIKTINDQDGFFTMLSRGKEAGKIVDRRDIVSSISRVISPFTQWPDLLDFVKSPQLKVVVSNTTEAGIFYREEPLPTAEKCPGSYASRLAALLYERFNYFGGKPGSGLLILPFELIENNGSFLRETVVCHAVDWKLPPEFSEWLDKENLFLNTLVDRIVTGVSPEESKKLWEELGYEDKLINAAEIFYQLFVEAPPGAEKLFPLQEAGLNVEWVDDLKPYRTRKVRLLNGAHTAVVPFALLLKIPTVRDAVNDPLIRGFMDKVLYREIIPATAKKEKTLSVAYLETFAGAVLERFENPFIEHYWKDISMNSISKFKTRNLPSFLDYIETENDLPPGLTLSLAALLSLYRGEKPGSDGMKLSGIDDFSIFDDADVLEVFYNEWSTVADDRNYAELRQVAGKLLGNELLWGSDLTRIKGLTEKVADNMQIIFRDGPGEALSKAGD